MEGGKRIESIRGIGAYERKVQRNETLLALKMEKRDKNKGIEVVSGSWKGQRYRFPPKVSR